MSPPRPRKIARPVAGAKFPATVRGAHNPRPGIFVSAVSKELKTARQLVANTLQFLGYEPIWQYAGHATSTSP